jgi:hypothetical protein
MLTDVLIVFFFFLTKMGFRKAVMIPFAMRTASALLSKFFTRATNSSPPNRAATSDILMLRLKR